MGTGFAPLGAPRGCAVELRGCWGGVVRGAGAAEAQWGEWVPSRLLDGLLRLPLPPPRIRTWPWRFPAQELRHPCGFTWRRGWGLDHRRATPGVLELQRLGRERLGRATLQSPLQQVGRHTARLPPLAAQPSSSTPADLWPGRPSVFLVLFGLGLSRNSGHGTQLTPGI